MTDPFSRLIDVAPRDAWAHEAHDFTPWLADNLDRLSEAIGVRLELTGREVDVGRYAADLLATNPQDGSVVLIENQLEASDHGHLGQIMTYLAGLEAQVVVWVAPSFREEHLSALRWLNANTDDRFSFFAVRLRVVRIADSPLAPLFEVLEKPNGWDRRLQSQVRAVVADPGAAAGGAAARADAFWPLYERYDPGVAGDRRIGIGATVRWRAIPGTGVVISRYRSAENVGIFLRGGWAEGRAAVLPRLQPVIDRLAETVGVPLGDPAFPFIKLRAIASGDPADLDAAAAWLAGETRRYEAALIELLGAGD